MRRSARDTPAHADGRFEITLVDFVAWLLQPALRRITGNCFHVRSPRYRRVQVVVDHVRSEKIVLTVRDSVDVAVLHQVFGSEDYGLNCLARYQEIMDWLADVRRAGKSPFIVDLGANTGLASLYFARVYPGAKVVAVEPDSNNVRVARRNLAPYANVHVIEGGIAASDGRGEIFDPGDGNWSYRTELSETGGVSMYSMTNLVAHHAGPDDIPFLVKIDIEGFESELFSRDTGWIDRFPILIIELHDWMLPGSGSSNNFLREIGRRNRDFVHRGENVFSIANDSWPVSNAADS